MKRRTQVALAVLIGGGLPLATLSPAQAQLAVSAAVEVAGEVVPDELEGPACATVSSLAPGVPGVVDIEPDGDTSVLGAAAYDCPPHEQAEAPVGHITIHHFPESPANPVARARLYAAPIAANGTPWACFDVNNGQLVGTGSELETPNPGVTCTPPSPYSDYCGRLSAGGYHADAGLGEIVVISECNGIWVDAYMKIPFNWPGYSHAENGNGNTPWSCRVFEWLEDRSKVDYWVFCDINLM